MVNGDGLEWFVMAGNQSKMVDMGGSDPTDLHLSLWFCFLCIFWGVPYC